MSIKDLPLFKLQVDKDSEGMDYMGLVDTPAHGKGWIAFKKTPEKVEFKSHFNEEKRIITGVAIATNLPIYRRDHSGFEYNVIFTKQDVKTIAIGLSENGYMNNVNEMHDMNKDVKDMALFESFFIEDDKRNIPDAFLDQNLQPGSWIVSYKVNNDSVWEKIKNGEFYGFSIEGWFKNVELTKSKLKKQKKMKRTLKEMLFGNEEVAKPTFDAKNRDKYATATDVDGNALMWEGELIEGTALFVEVEGEEPILAAAGDYTIDSEGQMTTVTVDEAGLITSVSTEEAAEEEGKEEEEVLEAMQAMKAAYKTALADQKKAFEDQLKVIADTVDQIRTEFEANKEDVEKAFEAKGIKFKKAPINNGTGFLATKKKTA